MNLEYEVCNKGCKHNKDGVPCELWYVISTAGARVEAERTGCTVVIRRGRALRDFPGPVGKGRREAS